MHHALDGVEQRVDGVVVIGAEQAQCVMPHALEGIARGRIRRCGGRRIAGRRRGLPTRRAGIEALQEGLHLGPTGARVEHVMVVMPAARRRARACAAAGAGAGVVTRAARVGTGAGGHSTALVMMVAT